MENEYEEVEKFGMKLRLVPIEKVKIAKTNVRGFRDQEHVERLKQTIDSLEEKGIDMPLLYPPLANNDNEVFEGGYRMEAMRRAGKKVIPLRILDLPDDEQIVISLNGGIQHQLHSEDEAKAVARLKELDGDKWTQKAIGKAIGRTQQQVSVISGLRKMKPDISEQIETYSVRPQSTQAKKRIAKTIDTMGIKPNAELTEKEQKNGELSREEFIKNMSQMTADRVDEVSERLAVGIPIDWNKEKKFIENRSDYYHLELEVTRADYAAYAQFCSDYKMDLEDLLMTATDQYIRFRRSSNP